MTVHSRHLRLVHSASQPLVESDPTRSGGIDLNEVAHREYRARPNPVDVPLVGPIMSREPVLPLWAIGLAAMILTPFVLHFVWRVIG